MAQRIMEIRITPAVEFKLRTKHGLTGAIVREAIQIPAQVSSEWVMDPVQGRRLYVYGFLSRKIRIVAYLHPVETDMGIWNLATAWLEVRKYR